MLTLGADPEFFIKQGNDLISIEGLLGGTKENPKVIDDHGDFKIQEDNVAAEYNIPASYTKEQFIKHILWPQDYIKALLGAKNITIYPKASASFPEKELYSMQAQTFGCEPDYNAWSGEMNDRPYCEDWTFRSCGGHVHFGTENKDEENIKRIIQNMDKTLGVWSVIVDEDNKRRQLYGKAGSFRYQKHGGEYRVLSNYWIFSPELISEVWDRAQLANTLEKQSKEEGELLQRIINTGDKDAAKKYCKSYGLS